MDVFGFFNDLMTHSLEFSTLQVSIEREAINNVTFLLSSNGKEEENAIAIRAGRKKREKPIFMSTAREDKGALKYTLCPCRNVWKIASETPQKLGNFFAI